MKHKVFEKPITPKARKYAKEHNMKLEGLEGSGEFGAIRFRDIYSNGAKRASSVARRAASYFGIDIESIPEEYIRKEHVLKAVSEKNSKHKTRDILNQQIEQSIKNMAPYTLFTELECVHLLDSYNIIKDWAAENYNIRVTLSDMYIFLVSRVLKQHPELNMPIGDGKDVNISFAANMQNGLIAPVIKMASERSVLEIALEKARLLDLAQTKNLTNDDLSEGTFTISNLGQSPVTHFTPIINYPQKAILGIGRTDEKPVVHKGKIAIQKTAYFSLTLDHYLLDGVDGANFFGYLKEGLENSLGFYRST